MSTPLLRVEGLSVSYNGIMALDGLSFDLREGTTLLLTGANGAGKSTALKAICGLLKPSRGRVLFRNEDVTAQHPGKLVQKGVSYVMQERGVFPNMSVQENLELGGFAIKPRDRLKSRLDVIFQQFPDMFDKRRLPAGALSGGEQQVLVLARSLVSDPALLLIDEPSLGLSPKSADRVYELLMHANQMGITTLLVEHNAGRGWSVADSVCVLRLGRLVSFGPANQVSPDELLGNVFR